MSLDHSPFDASALAPLFEPYRCRGATLSNRWVMSPMTREFSPGNLLNAQAPSYYARRIQGGLGAIITEGAAVPHAVSHQNARVPNFSGLSLERWSQVAAAVHAAGGCAFAQLWHTGLYRTAPETLNPDEVSVAPSQVGKTPVREMTAADISSVVDAYATAASNAQAAGFDGVEIHGAHGYLPDQFFWTSTNRRTDAYGGPIENRVRFAVELVSEVRRRTGGGFVIIFRFSQWKGLQYDAKVVQTPQELERWLRPLADAGVDVFDASTRRFWLPEFEGSDLNLAGWAKKVTGKASMTVGSVGLESPLTVSKIGAMESASVSSDNLSRLCAMFDRGDFDLVAVGRIVLTNPDWPQLVRAGRFHDIKAYDAEAVAARLECGV